MKVSGPAALVTVLYVIAIMGALHLLAVSKPDSKIAQAYLGLGF